MLVCGDAASGLKGMALWLGVWHWLRWVKIHASHIRAQARADEGLPGHGPHLSDLHLCDLSEPSGAVGSTSVQEVGATPFEVTSHVQLRSPLAN